MALKLSAWRGFQLQEVTGNERETGLGFWGASQMHWLWFELDAQRPLVLPVGDRAPKHTLRLKPVHLFLRAHFRNQRLEQALVDAAQGRILFIDFLGEDLRIEARLFPHGQNIIVKAADKQVSWAPCKALEKNHQVVESSLRALEEIVVEWQALRQKKTQGGVVDAQTLIKQWQKDREKKIKALSGLQEVSAQDMASTWRQAGEWLKGEGGMLFPQTGEEWRDKVDGTQSLAWNIQNCFTQAQKVAGKKTGQRERIIKLQEEIAALDKKIANPETAKPAKTASSILHAAKAKGRRLVLASGAEAVFGKSAADNLQILRAAKAWDLWLHLKDFPGAHAIIHRAKGKDVGDNEVMQVAQWVAAESLHHKGLRPGDRLDVLVAECRFVRPIKGDRVGRVNYSNERVLSLKYADTQG